MINQGTRFHKHSKLGFITGAAWMIGYCSLAMGQQGVAPPANGYGNRAAPPTNQQSTVPQLEFLPDQRGDIDGTLRAIDAGEELLQAIRRATAVAGDDRSDAVVNIVVGGETIEQAEFDVRVDVDEPGCHDLPRRIDGAGRRVILEPANRDDPPVAHGDIAVEPVVAGAIDDAAILDEDIDAIARDAIGWRRDRASGDTAEQSCEKQSHRNTPE